MPDPSTITPEIFLVTLTFDPTATTTPFQFGGDMVGNQLTVDSPLAIIILKLVPASGQSLRFADAPIVWLADPAPAGFIVQRNSDTQVTIVDVNTNLSGATVLNGFSVTLFDGDTLQTSNDPTILNAEIPPPVFFKREGEGPRVKSGAALHAV